MHSQNLVYIVGQQAEVRHDPVLARMSGFELRIKAAVACSFLAGADRSVVASLLRRSRLRDVPAGRVFIDESQPHRCGLVVSGLARVYILRTSGGQSTLRRVGVGAAVGIRALVGHPNRVAVQAIDDCEFLELDAPLLISLARQHASLAMALAEEIDRRLEDTELQAESLSVGSLIQRVAGTLLDLSVEGEPLEVQLSQEALAEIVGASRERVGRGLRLLAADGAIRLHRSRITLVAPLQLQSVARKPGLRGGRRMRVFD